MAGKADDARAAGADHGDLDPIVQPKFLDALNLIRTPNYFGDPTRLAGAQSIQRNQSSHCSHPPGS